MATAKTQEKPDRILYYESYVEVRLPVFGHPNPVEISRWARDHGFKHDMNGSVAQLWNHSANKETVIEALTEFLSLLKKHNAEILCYRYGAVYVDSNNWDTLGVLGNDPHADKR